MAKKEKAVASKASSKKSNTTVSKETDNAASKKGSKSGLIIIIVVLVLCLVCGGLGVGGYLLYKKAKEKADNALNGNLTDLIEESVEQGIEKETGQDSDFSFSGKLPSNFPDDVKIYPDSEIGISSSTDNESGKSIYVSLSTTDSVEQVVSFYKDKVASEGWNITSETEFLGFSIIANKGDRDLTVYVYDGEDGKTYYTITING